MSNAKHALYQMSYIPESGKMFEQVGNGTLQFLAWSWIPVLPVVALKGHQGTRVLVLCLVLP
jgi:hypothetical protein